LHYNGQVKRLGILAFCLLAVGCAGSSSSDPGARFAGTWRGIWVNNADANDAGTSEWTISRTGVVTGQDTDPGRATTFNVAGNVDVTGRLTSTSTPSEGAPATLNGPLSFDSEGHLTGDLVWGVQPPLTYRYTFNRIE
jgi:hypothetical protein